MEYIILIVTMAMFLLIIFVKGTWDEHRAQKRLIEKLYNDYGELPDKEYKPERFVRIDSYYKEHPEENQIDDITWNDLNMDDVFKRMNYTLSSTGEEYLYYTLRTPRMDEGELLHREKMTDYFVNNADDRVKVQLLLKRLGNTGKYSLYDYLKYLDVLGERSSRREILLNLLLFPLVLLCILQPSLGSVGIVAWISYRILTYHKEKKEIEPYIISFAYIMRLMDVCDRLTRLQIPVCEEEWKSIRRHNAVLSGMKRGSSLVMSGSMVGSGGNPLEIVIDYLKMVFHVDIIVFNKMLSELNRHLKDVDVLIEQVGKVETAICIGTFRISSDNGWCRPVFIDSRHLEAEGIYHPLIGQPVKNDISADRGVLLTGSNASGKSTFLKTIALNAVLAQTVFTCMADSYRAPFCRIYSSMALKDDIGSGESYYIVEIKALKRILDAAKKTESPVLCFVDEVLRGTNTVERIAASTQILKSLSDKNLLCFAATHDIELTELLKEYYENYHFEEDIRDGDILFNYKLQKGKATTRNAIRLLEIMGYDESIIRKASELAGHFVENGVWELT